MFPVFYIPSLTRATALLLTVSLIGLLNWTKCSFAGFSNPKIFGGNPAKPGEFPWIISIQRKLTEVNDDGKPIYKHECGGAILNNIMIVTAAHCTWNRSTTDFQIVAGAHNIKIKEETQQIRYVSHILKHSSHSTGKDPGAYDVALFTLDSPFKLNKRVTTIKLAEEKEMPKGACYNAGWGNLFPITKLYQNPSDVLVKGKTNVITKESCSQAYPTLQDHLKTAICGQSDVFNGNCQGDSGGPLTCYRDDESPYLAGLVSFGFQLCHDGIHPDVYTDVGHPEILKFIQGNLKTGRGNGVDELPKSGDKIVKGAVNGATAEISQSYSQTQNANGQIPASNSLQTAGTMARNFGVDSF